MNRSTFGCLALLWLSPIVAVAGDDPAAFQLLQRLDALQADPVTQRLAGYEQMQARRAIDALNAARKRDRDAVLYVAQRRVEIAEITAHTESMQQELNDLDRQYDDLRVEASRREAERARQQAERLRIQAQIQAEEAERMRQEAEAEAAARADVEQTLTNVAGRQTAQLSAARRKEAELSRQEAELVTGATLPASRFSGNNEVFTVDGNAYVDGTAGLSPSGQGNAQALAAYLQIGRNTSVRIEAYDSDTAQAQARADSLKASLVAAGVSSNRIRASGKNGAATRARSAVVTVSP
ncbi:MAG: hypothetical protein LBL59_10650 [Xanthomonadaceae bacterium]|jgi:outer membrane protein OmpA-like peptidoglycan-associated protein|nr:hypothetical protein [Xanthomonadaceae bacterium]